jgi:hypothetical protein
MGRAVVDDGDQVRPESCACSLFMGNCDIPAQRMNGGVVMTRAQVPEETSAPALTVDGITARDLNKSGRLDPYEDPGVVCTDWRLLTDQAHDAEVFVEAKH